ncbi:hypothetical protein [Archangium lansingense]|uniref:Uncharacterized protein n=1 Tax=Archangium lansingense TaxID=2995310 RepID=A0ABT4AQ66_9BACT|nr:hypothetical protein [Archangium lansinium]MCY1083406.1 hypothetical protein [Archangium lansinium]
MPEPPRGPERDARIPPGSADYSAALADATLYKQGALSFAELQARVLARGLPPHPLGDAYLMVSPPPPPPGVIFSPLVMPYDWARTWGEIAMTLFAGDLTREEYERLHAAAHPDCPR